MKIKTIASVCALVVLAACGDASQNPEKLKGANFVTKSGDTQITLAFAPEDMRINGRVVNLYNASYTANGDNIKFGDMLSTMMMGPMDAMNAEQEYFQFMATVEKYDLNNGRLTLRDASGREMVFTQVDTLPDPDAPADTGTDAVVESETVIETETETVAE